MAGHDYEIVCCRGCQWTGPGINYRTVRSPHGFALDSLKSALQKYIRRAEVAKAVFCAREIHCISASQLREDGARSPRAQAVITNLMHRLLIIFMEDCGPPAAQWTEFVLAAAQDVINLGRNGTMTEERFAFERGKITMLSAALARMRHSRFFSHIGNVFAMSEAVDRFARIDPRFQCLHQLHFDAQEPINDEFNEHIRALAVRPQIMPADFQHLPIFHIQHCNEKRENDPIRGMASVVGQMFDIIETILKDSREVFLVPMMWCAYWIYHRYELPEAPSATIFALSVQEMAEFDTFILAQLDDYALDRHTTEGRILGNRSRTQFALSGAQVANEDPKWTIPLLQEFYVISKRIQDGENVVPEPILRPVVAPGALARHDTRMRESDLLEFCIHAQLTTGMGKTDTYFAQIRADDEIRAACHARGDNEAAIAHKLKCARKMRHVLCGLNANGTRRDRNPVFAKGPLPERVIRAAIEISQIKRCVFAEIPSTPLLYLFCDDFDLFTSPIGQRVIWARNPSEGRWGLLFSRNLTTQGMDERDFSSIERTSNVYGPTRVVKWTDDEVVTNQFVQSLVDDRDPATPNEHMKQICMAYIFRFVLAIGDGALRNLVRSGGNAHDSQCIAVDEDLIRNPPHPTWREFVDSLGSNAIKALLSEPFCDVIRDLLPCWLERLQVLRDNIVAIPQGQDGHVVNLGDCIYRLSTLMV